jgi:hypothetical protein
MNASPTLAPTFFDIEQPHALDSWEMTAMLLPRHLSRSRQYVCQSCVRRQHTLARGERPPKRWAAEDADAVARNAAWQEQAGRIRSGAQQSMLSVLEERGFVKDVAGWVCVAQGTGCNAKTPQRPTDARLAPH